MSDHHLRNIETGSRPAVGLGMAVEVPLLNALAPFILIGLALLAAYLFLSWSWAAALLPFARSDEVLDTLLLDQFGAGGAIWGAVALVGLVYVVAAVAGCHFRGWRLLNPRLFVGILAASAVAVGVAGAVNGTHYPGQIAYALKNPGRSATMAWNCPARLADGSAERHGRYDLYSCLSYVREDDMRGACREVMRRMAPLRGPQVACSSHIRALAAHEWPVEGSEYKEWETSFRKPVRNLPLATPALTPRLLAKAGLTPAR